MRQGRSVSSGLVAWAGVRRDSLNMLQAAVGAWSSS